MIEHPCPAGPTGATEQARFVVPAEPFVKTRAFFHPFDLFGSGGAGNGARLLADALREILADNKQERRPTRADAYTSKVIIREFDFETVPDYEPWRAQARRAVRQTFRGKDFLLWVTGNHLGVLPVYDELAGAGSASALVVQFDAHLDIYNLSDCTRELSHGNFLLHCERPLPAIINVGARELLLRPKHVRKYYRETFPAECLAIDPEPALKYVRDAAAAAKQVFLDIDCDVFDPAFFPAVSHPLPFGISPQLLLRFLDAVCSEKVTGVALSEFDPGHDRHDQSLGTLVWLLEYLLLKRYER